MTETEMAVVVNTVKRLHKRALVPVQLTTGIVVGEIREIYVNRMTNDICAVTAVNVKGIDFIQVKRLEDMDVPLAFI